MQEKTNAFQRQENIYGQEVLKGFSILQVSTVLTNLELLNIKSFISQSDTISELLKSDCVEMFSSIAKELASITFVVRSLTTAISIIGHISSLIFNEDDLNDYGLERQCTEAWELDEVINAIEYEKFRFRRYFD